MVYNGTEGVWIASIPLDMFASTVEFFTNHGLYVDGRHTYISSPYTRVPLSFELPSFSKIALIISASAIFLTGLTTLQCLFAGSLYLGRDREPPNS